MTLNKISQNDIPYGSDSPSRVCEMCHTRKPSHLMIGFLLSAPAGGHPLVSYGCVQHWVCSIACLQSAAPFCLHEHMLPELEALLKKAYEDVPL